MKISRIISILILTPYVLLAATTGKMSGRIIDFNTDAPLFGVNIVLKGTDMGASCNEKGIYFILNVPPGRYTLEATMIGYKKMVIEDLRVIVDHTTEANFKLETTILLGEEVVVVAEKPLIQKDVTSTLKTMDYKDIENMPVNSYQEVLNTSTGVIFTGDDENQVLHVRGSRSGEVIYLIDGFAVDDVVYRGMASEVSTGGISELSLITGTFNAEYGEAAAAVVNIITKEGRSYYSGDLKFLSDKVGRIFKKERFRSDFNSDRIEGSIGGPFPLGLKSFGSFFFSGDIYSTDTYLGRVPIPRTIINPLESEQFTDLNGNKFWDEGEDFIDADTNGVWTFETGEAIDGTELKKGNFRNTETFRKQKRFSGKLVLKPFKNIKTTIGYTGFREESRGYSQSFKQIPTHNAHTWNYSDLYSFTLNHSLSPSTYYQIKVSQFNNMYAEGLPRLLNDKFEFSKKTYGEPYVDANGNSAYDEGEGYTDTNGNEIWDSEAEWWSYMPEPFLDANKSGVYDEGEDFSDLNGNGTYDLGLIPALRVNLPEIGSNYEFWGKYNQIDVFGDTIREVTSDDDYWQKNISKTTTVGAFIVSQITENHQIKVGFDLEKHWIRNRWISGISPSDPQYHSQETNYTKNPIQASTWIQDKMELMDMVINLGIRLDYLEPQGEYLRDPWNPYIRDQEGKVTDSLDLVKADNKWQISPRLGFGYPVTDKTLFRFSYGKFFQNPGFDRFWRRLNEEGTVPFNFSQGYIPTFGNPNLKPQSTTAYEFGMEQIVSENIKLTATLFYKDQYNYPTSYIYDVDPSIYAMFINGDYANSKGIEISFNKRFSNFWAAQINYTYSKAEGNADDEWTHWDEAYSASVYGTFPSKKTITMYWDQPHTLNFIVNIRKPRNWGINIIGNLGSGLPYTPTDARGRNIDETNSARKPPTVNIDVRMNKDFVFNKFTLRLFSDIYNVLNFKNVIYVFSSTGQPNQSANPNASLDWVDRPYYYGAPRHMEIGIDILFDQRGGSR
ncbi:MAG: TonB-dependent receptor [Candidatus Marinimicrobia bacterium]|nr:TonB-dependent receptor [Candidatus Neomarinimicrobiota bacterium]